MGLLEDMLAEAGSETGIDPMAKMATELIAGQGEAVTDPKSSALNKILLGLSGVGGLVGGGGPKGALSAITPAGWRNIAPETRLALTEFANKFPDWWSAFLKHPRESVISQVTDLPEKTLGTWQSINPLSDRIQFGLKQGLFGKPSPVGPDTIMHEGTHQLTASKLASMVPEDAATIGTLLSEFLPPRGQGSLKYRMRSFNDLLKDLEGTPLPRRGESFVLPKNHLTKLKEIIAENQRSIGSEGLSYLAERTVFPETSTKLQDLARQLGVGVKATTPTAGSTLLDDVLESLKQLRGAE